MSATPCPPTCPKAGIEKVFGEEPSHSGTTPTDLHRASLSQTLLATLDTKPAPTEQDNDALTDAGVSLPVGDAGSDLMMLLGALLMLSGLAMIFWLRREASVPRQ